MYGSLRTCQEKVGKQSSVQPLPLPVPIGHCLVVASAPLWLAKAEISSFIALWADSTGESLLLELEHGLGKSLAQEVGKPFLVQQTGWAACACLGVPHKLTRMHADGGKQAGSCK